VAGAVVRESVARRRAAGWGFVALGLVAIVAMEANGAAWSRHRGAEVHALPHGVLVAGGVAAVLLVLLLVVLMLTTARVVETPAQRRKRWTTAIAFIVVIALISIVRLLFHPSHSAQPSNPSSRSSIGRTEVGSASAKGHGGETWWPLVVVGLGIAAALATAVIARPEPQAAPDTGVDDATIAMLDASLDDLRTEPDPRRAVTAAYARTERGLAARGFARRPSETPTEYLQRALVGRGATSDVGPLAVEPFAVEAFAVEPLGELTALAERARFSALQIDEEMRSSAISALEALRRELRAAALAGRERVD
jgi:NADH:ubiquinone oxidoreductase subunit 6 (subunit J)